MKVEGFFKKDCILQTILSLFYHLKNKKLLPKRGNITKISNPNTVLSKVTGSWLENITFDEEIYWDLEKVEPAVLIKSLDPLPSDCRYREDLIWLAKRDLEKAQE